MRLLNVAFAALLLAGNTNNATQAAEGMWTFNEFPAYKVEKTHGFRPDQTWLDHIRLSTLRLGGGSASFVSPNGLVLTNHHAVSSCISQVSSPAQDFLSKGFFAKDVKDEVKCPGLLAEQLIAISDLTERINKAVAGKDGQEFANALFTEKVSAATECAGSDPNIYCEVVELYSGGIHNLYRYLRYPDIRLVFAPEQAIAGFGGDPDNFEFPRFALDFAYVRVYLDNKPLDTTSNYLRHAEEDVRSGDLTFMSGIPLYTNRLDTVAQLEFQRDVTLPRTLIYYAELVGLLTEFSNKGAEEARIASDLLDKSENVMKAYNGMFAALVDPALIKLRAASEEALRAKVAADPQMQARYGATWDNIRSALDDFRRWRDRYQFTAGRWGIYSEVFDRALILVRHADEVLKPEEERLPDYTSANLASTVRSATSTAPVYSELDKLTLTFSLTKMRQALGADDPFVRKVLAGRSPRQRATELIDGSGLANPKLSAGLLAAGRAGIEASSDPMIVFARSIDPELRVILREYDHKIRAVETKNAGLIAKAMFQVYGTTMYPDATGTLRLSYGEVAGYREGAKLIEPITRMAGLFERATGAEPFKLPERWLDAKAKPVSQQALNFVTTNDAVGGSSGSPLVNKSGQLVGLVFDINIHGLGGYFAYNPAHNRVISISVGAMREALSKIYQADRIIEEISR